MIARLLLSLALTAGAMPLVAEAGTADVIVVDALTRRAATGGAHAEDLRRLAVGVRAGRVSLAEAERVLAILAHLASLEAPRARSVASRGGGTAAPEAPAVRGGVDAVEAVLDGSPPPAAVAEPVDPPAADPASAAAEVVKIQGGKDGGPDMAMLEGEGLGKGQMLMVRRDERDVVELMVLRSEEGLALGMVLGATWADDLAEEERAVVSGDRAWLLEGADEP